MQEQQVVENVEFMDLLLGEMSRSEWLFSLFLMFLGAFLWVLHRLRNRKNKTVPFSFNTWVSNIDNVIAVFITIIMTYILIRFYSDYQEALASQLPQGLKRTPYFTMLIVGFGQHKLSEWVGKKTK